MISLVPGTIGFAAAAHHCLAAVRDLLATRQLNFCLQGQGLKPGELRVLLEGKPLRMTDFKRDGQHLSF